MYDIIAWAWLGAVAQSQSRPNTPKEQRYYDAQYRQVRLEERRRQHGGGR